MPKPSVSEVVERARAIEVLARDDAKRLTAQELAEIAEEWWRGDESDDELQIFPPRLRASLAMSRGRPLTADVLDELVWFVISERYRGVVNAYLKEKLERLLGRPVEVEGQVDSLQACSCCGYLTLRERGVYLICPVCFWEDDGSTELDRFSGPNRMTLREGRESFLSFGASSRGALPAVDPDGARKFLKE